jgi:Domain of unknown function (DUF4783)
MKTSLLLTALAVILLGLSAFHFTQNTPIDQVVTALKKGNAGELSKYFDNTIEISLPDRSDSYSRSQAEIVLKDFFDTKGVQNFQAGHKGSKNGSEYCIGVLITRSGSFRTTVYMKQKTDRQLLQEVRIESSK